MADSSFISPSTKNAATKRNIKQVPFVELFNHRLQGVVSSGSDIERVYVSFFEAGTLDYYCSTNNNRPCGGLRGSPCNHLQAVMIEAIAAYGLDQVTNYLKIPGDVSHIHSAFDIIRRCGAVKKEPASEVFSRFLNYLRYLELETSNSPLPEMSWFV
jgi:hypothetical protein